MRRFKRRLTLHYRLSIIIALIIISFFYLLNYYNYQISPKILNIAISKLEEISVLYIKQDITPRNIALDSLIITTKNSDDEILTVDVNMDYAYAIMLEIIQNIQSNLLKLEQGDIAGFANHRELLSHNGNLYLSIPLGLTYDGVLLANLGPHIPVKLSFYEHVLGTVETTITEYGINNALMNVYLTVSLDQKLIIPYQEEVIKRDYTLLLGSKIISGKVPAFYGGYLRDNSPIIDVQ